MLFKICIIVLIVGVVLLVLSNVDWYHKEANAFNPFKGIIDKFIDVLDDCSGFMQVTGTILLFVGVIAVGICVAVLCTNYIGIDARVNKYNETYNALIYKAENESCRDDFGLLSKEVIDEIQDWNEDVVYYQSIQDDYWLGIFYPDVYDQFKVIDYEKYSK